MSAPQPMGIETLVAVHAAGLVKRYGDVPAVDGLDIEIAAWRFSREAAYEPMIHVIAGRAT